MPTRHLPALLGICTLLGGCDQSAVNDTESEMAPPDTNTGVNLVVSCNPAATVAWMP